LADFQSGTTLLKASLNVHHSKLPIFHFAMPCHRPQESDAMPMHGNVGMIPAWHQNRITIVHYGNQFRV